MKKFIPFLSWIKSYDRSTFLGDLPAGLTVGVMLIPQGMAYAMIAGLPPVYGLYAALVPQIIYAFLGTSRQLAVGPVAMDSLLVASGLSLISTVGSEEYILLAICLALLMGLMQFVMGLFKLGFLVNFLSRPVISGFTSAAAFIIGLNQLKHIMGVDIARSNKVHLVLWDAINKMDEVHFFTLGLGLAAIVMLKLMKRYTPRIPAALAAVVLGIASVSIFHLESKGIAVVGAIPEGLPLFTIPSLNSDNFSELLPIAGTLALIAFMEAISISKAMEQRQKEYKVVANQELIALGLSNVIASFFQSYPTTGGFSRTAVNVQSGARSGIAALISAAVVGLTLLFLTSLFYNLPNAILGAIIIVSVIGLVDFSYPIRLWKKRKQEFFLLIFTFFITLVVGIKEGILYGVGLSLLLLIYRTTKPHLAILGRIDETDLYKNLKRFPNAQTLKGTLILRFDAQLYFANAQYFKENLERAIREEQDLSLLIISCEGINYMDSSAAQMLLSLFTDIKKQGICIALSSAIGPLRDILEKSGIADIVGRENMFNSVGEAVRCYQSGSCREKLLLKIATQTNWKEQNDKLRN